MRFLNIALFVFMIHIMVAVIATIGILPSIANDKQLANDWFASVSQANIKGETYSQGVQDTGSTSFNFGDFVSGFWQFIKEFSYSVIYVPRTFEMFGINQSLATLFSYPVYILYLLALGQFISNRSTLSMK